MALPKPYGGNDIQTILNRTDESFAWYNATMPVEDLGGFNPKVRGYGTLWAERSDMGRNCGHVVVAGVVGNMSGVPIAELESDEAARAYAKDFEAGKVVALMNHARWTEFVKAAHAAKPIDASHLSFLKSRSSRTAIAANGIEIDSGEIAKLYNKGM